MIAIDHSYQLMVRFLLGCYMLAWFIECCRVV